MFDGHVEGEPLDVEPPAVAEAEQVLFLRVCDEEAIIGRCDDGEFVGGDLEVTFLGISDAERAAVGQVGDVEQIGAPVYLDLAHELGCVFQFSWRQFRTILDEHVRKLVFHGWGSFDLRGIRKPRDEKVPKKFLHGTCGEVVVNIGLVG